MEKRLRHRIGNGGQCVCPKCGTKVAHQHGARCMETECPECGTKMFRDHGYKQRHTGGSDRP